jgi:hypothetical protein
MCGAQRAKLFGLSISLDFGFALRRSEESRPDVSVEKAVAGLPYNLLSTSARPKQTGSSLRLDSVSEKVQIDS